MRLFICFFVDRLDIVKEFSLRVVPNMILSDVGISSYPVSPKTKKKNSRKILVFIQKKLRLQSQKIAVKNSPIKPLRAF